MQVSLLKTLYPLLLALIFNGAGHAFFVITIPAIARVLQLKDISVGLILSLSSILLVVTGPVWGWLCDKIGRKKVLIIGLLSSAITTLFLATLLDSHHAITPGLFAILLFGIRTIHAALSAGLKPATQAIAADVSKNEGRIAAMAIMGATFGIGTLFGGVLAMLSGHQHVVIGYSLLGILMLFSSLWVASKLPETNITTVPKPPPYNHKPFVIYWTTTLVGLTIYSALQPITNWYLQDVFSFNADQAIQYTGAIMMSSMIAMILSQLCLVVRRNNPFVVRRLGFVISILALIGCAFSKDPRMLLVAMAILGIGFGLFLPANLSLMTRSVPTLQQGRIAGINGLCQGTGLAMGPILGAVAYQIQKPLFYHIAAITVCALLLACRLIKLR
ncbi:MAG: MFS transporter [Pseudomonadota bacterium]